MQCTCNVTLRRVRATVVVVEKQCVTYSECVLVDLVIHHANHMRHIVLPSLVCLALQNFTHYLINGTVFEKKYI
jgi:hypothetical protein